MSGSNFEFNDDNRLSDRGLVIELSKTVRELALKVVELSEEIAELKKGGAKQ